MSLEDPKPLKEIVDSIETHFNRTDDPNGDPNTRNQALYLLRCDIMELRRHANSIPPLRSPTAYNIATIIDDYLSTHLDTRALACKILCTTKGK